LISKESPLGSNFHSDCESEKYPDPSSLWDVVIKWWLMLYVYAQLFSQWLKSKLH